MQKNQDEEEEHRPLCSNRHKPGGLRLPISVKNILTGVRGMVPVRFG